MDIDDPPGPLPDEFGRQDPHVSRETDEVGPRFPEDPADLRLVFRSTRETLALDGKGGQPALPCALEPARTGDVRNDRDDLRFRNPSRAHRVGNGFEVRSAPGEEHGETAHCRRIQGADRPAPCGRKRKSLWRLRTTQEASSRATTTVTAAATMAMTGC